MIFFSDGHCDFLYKKSRQESTVISPAILKEANVIMQNFAIFVEPSPNIVTNLEDILVQIKLFQENICSDQDITFVTNKNQVDEYLKTNRPKMLALLSIEGCDTIHSSNDGFHRIWSSGVRIFALTWNSDNHLATSCTTSDKRGLTEEGVQFISDIVNKRGIVDVSHLSERSFWDSIELPKVAPSIVASHSNCKTLCNHVRNLTDEQIKAIISCDGVIGINFVPMFLRNDRNAGMIDVIRHIEKILELGGDNHVAIGSDFDGAKVIDELSSPQKLMNLANELHKHYDKPTIEKITHLNWLAFLRKKLPK